MIVVAAWNGTIIRDHLTYATAGHPDYKRYPIRDFIIANMENET